MTPEQKAALRNAAYACDAQMREAIDTYPMDWEMIGCWARTLQTLADWYMGEPPE